MCAILCLLNYLNILKWWVWFPLWMFPVSSLLWVGWLQCRWIRSLLALVQNKKSVVSPNPFSWLWCVVSRAETLVGRLLWIVLLQWCLSQWINYMQVEQWQYVTVMAAAMLLHYVLFTVMNMNCACASCSMRHETLALAMRSICIFFNKTQHFWVPGSFKLF